MGLVVGTRGSRLALAQTNTVVGELRRRCTDCDIKVIKTSGDVFIEKALADISGVGVFVRELDEMIMREELDCAVHSLKDMPTELPEGLEISAVLPRASRNDCLLSNHGGLEELPLGAVVGTSSVRRSAQLLRFRRDLVPRPIRGNVDTRIRKVDGGTFCALVLAKAGLERLDLTGISMPRIIDLSLERFPTSAGQGAMAVVSRKGSEASALLGALDDPKTRLETEVEREVLRVLGGGCIAPVAVNAFRGPGGVRVRAEVLSLDGSRTVSIEEHVSPSDHMAGARAISEKMGALGGDRLIEEAKSNIKRQDGALED